jgi:hypothetical protein
MVAALVAFLSCLSTPQQKLQTYQELLRDNTPLEAAIKLNNLAMVKRLLPKRKALPPIEGSHSLREAQLKVLGVLGS